MVAIARRVQRSSIGIIYFQPKTKSVSQNNTFVASLYVSAPKPVTVVQVTIAYDSSKLQFVSIDGSTSPFDTTIQADGSVSGTVSISRAKLVPSGITGALLISNITFQALTVSGATPVSISSGNAAMNGSYTNPSLSNSLVVTIA
jgi:hypothetical protein